MKRISLLLLFFLFISCVGQHRTNQQLSQSHLNYDCETLFKKQKLQYKVAIREDKVSQRIRKKAVTEKRFALKRNVLNTEREKFTSAFQQKDPAEHVGTVLL